MTREEHFQKVTDLTQTLLSAATAYVASTDGNMTYTQQQEYLRGRLTAAIKSFETEFKEADSDAVGSGDEQVQIGKPSLVQRVGAEGEKPKAGDSDHAVGEEFGFQQTGVSEPPKVE